MDRFLSNTIHSVDKKGRVSIPASFRAFLNSEKQTLLYTLLSIGKPSVEAGGRALLENYEKRIRQMDPFSEEYELWSFHLHGDSQQLKIDGDGRVVISDEIREHTKIKDAVAFVGRGHFFQLWEPECFKDYQAKARRRVAEMRSMLGSNYLGKEV